MPVEVAGVRVSVGRAAEAAQTVCAEYADEALYHHCARSYLFGAAWAQTYGLDSDFDFDRELAGRTKRPDGRVDRAPHAGRCRAGTSADVSGTGLAAFAPSFVDTLVGAYPRQGFAHSFVRLFKDQAERTSSHALDKHRRV
ncbi:hypothetical protein [Streptomyces niveus]|uniref:hypothetical protein n=1 Tax=Streptomyces niveus TaxID=193462 RepID=UPI0034497B5C